MSLILSGKPEELRDKFLSLQTVQDIADLLEVDYELLKYHLYIVTHSKRYTTFNIPKKSGGFRKVTAPITSLKIIQQKLNQVLQHVYKPKPSTHGFLLKRNILTNAGVHSKREYVFNVDLKDFFPSINFGRVRGLFMGIPYKLNPKVATVLAQICCFDNQLPQGAPTSPIISNMICAKMDTELQRLARSNNCIYTRYADDITFSTNMPNVSTVIAKTDSLGSVEVGSELFRIIKENGFEINLNKVRLLRRNQRQEVTGLTTNKFPNVGRKFVRQIRAMIYAWKKFGLQAAEAAFFERYDKKHR